MASLEDLLNASVDARIQYFDVDRKTIMHENCVNGCVHHVDVLQGIVIAVDNNKTKLFKVPPAIEAWQQQLDGSFTVRWAVYRTQEKRVDGQHEWWDWQAQMKV